MAKQLKEKVQAIQWDGNNSPDIVEFAEGYELKILDGTTRQLCFINNELQGKPFDVISIGYWVVKREQTGTLEFMDEPEFKDRYGGEKIGSKY
ncbi:hypothetical protein D3C73_944860 [compost metagenome]